MQNNNRMTTELLLNYNELQPNYSEESACNTKSGAASLLVPPKAGLALTGILVLVINNLKNRFVNISVVSGVFT